ncbi:carbonic anhydrase [Lentinula boryana]|uniref:Carbonic anhydrase n=1 Tax=Lentinula boryana TaxID=40481 RepID=A0ABQ8PYV8_9AGAR|nr:carbonic anhydrase [Lentinula boryana]
MTHCQHRSISQMLSGNVRWAERVEQTNPNFFPESTRPQSPHTLWIGCGDSRVPETVITGTRPGDIFVNRNVGNQVQFGDENLMATLVFAVHELGVRNVIVCGHTYCGAVNASFRASGSIIPGRTPITLNSHAADSPLNRFLAPLTTSIANLITSLQISSVAEEEAIPILIRENVKVQVDNLCETEVVKNAWRDRPQGQELTIHGWLYDVGTGRIQDLDITRGPELVPTPHKSAEKDAE